MPTLESVISMLNELLERHTASAVSQATGINQLTIGRLKNGKGTRVSEKVSTAIETLYTEWKTGKAELASGRVRKGERKEKAEGQVRKARKESQPKPLTVDEEILQLEAKLQEQEIIKIDIEFLKKKKELIARHEQELAALEQERLTARDALEQVHDSMP